MSRKTFKFPEEMVERHKPRKKASGLSWPEYFDGEVPKYDYVTPEEVRQIVREECDNGSSDVAVSNEDLRTDIKALSEKIDTLVNSIGSDRL